MKNLSNSFLFLSIIGMTFGRAILTPQFGRDRAPAARELRVYPGYNEIQATQKYKDSLRSMLDRVKSLHHNLDLFKDETEREVTLIVDKINAMTDKDAYDDVLNSLMADELSKPISV